MAQTLELMRCDRRRMTLSRPGCAKLWLSTVEREPATWEGRHACLNCPVGAANAGRPLASVAIAVAAIRGVCPRCRGFGARIIGGHLCISCYNRQREVERGRNAKGTRPRLADRLHPESLAVVEAGAGRTVCREGVIAPAELVVALAKAATGWMAFGRRGAHAWG